MVVGGRLKIMRVNLYILINDYERSRLGREFGLVSERYVIKQSLGYYFPLERDMLKPLINNETEIILIVKRPKLITYLKFTTTTRLRLLLTY